MQGRLHSIIPDGSSICSSAVFARLTPHHPYIAYTLWHRPILPEFAPSRGGGSRRPDSSLIGFIVRWVYLTHTPNDILVESAVFFPAEFTVFRPTNGGASDRPTDRFRIDTEVGRTRNQQAATLHVGHGLHRGNARRWLTPNQPSRNTKFYKGFKQQKWPSNSPKVIGIMALKLE